MMDISRQMLYKFITIPSKYHLIVGFVVRLILIACGEYIDQTSEVPYTDVDYYVFTDAARYLYQFASPYERHTYRYSPLLALFLTPNIVIHRTCGKILFSIIDVIVGILILKIVIQYVKDTSDTTHQKLADENAKLYGKCSMLVWIYNPMAVVIATRGNADSIAAFLVLATLYFIYVKRDCYAAGICHGLACHFRIYPIVFSLTLFMHLSDFCVNLRPLSRNKSIIPSRNPPEKRTIFKKRYLYYLIPNKNQLKLILGTVWTFGSLLLVCYLTFGYKFLYETYLYHLFRKDTRHNFSVYFYSQYLSADFRVGTGFPKLLSVLPNLVLVVVFGVRYGLYKNSLFFAIFAQAFTLVSYNTVMTSQYFIWFLSILPLIVWHVQMSVGQWAKLGVLWMIGQGAWLLPAYLLEFRGSNTFIFIWWQSVGFFAANILILSRLIKYFSPLLKSEKLE